MRALITVVAILTFTPAALAQAPQPPAPASEAAPQTKRVQPGPWSVERLMDTQIRTREGEEVGEIEDLLVDDSGKIVSVVVEVGGVLGLGEKNVLLPFEDIELTRDGDGNVLLKSNSDKAKLEAAPEYKAEK